VIQLPRINENKLAEEIAEREGGKKNLTIAQIKEVQRHLLDLLAEKPCSDVFALIAKHAKPLGADAAKFMREEMRLTRKK
jgi:hypothetical protein